LIIKSIEFSVELYIILAFPSVLPNAILPITEIVSDGSGVLNPVFPVVLDIAIIAPPNV